MIGVLERTWSLAQNCLGPQIRTATLVLVFDRHCADEVASPGGNLRGMVEKRQRGERREKVRKWFFHKYDTIEPMS